MGNMCQIDNPGEVVLNCLAFDTMFNGSNVLNTALWTISFELYGSFIVYAFLVFTHFARYRIAMLIVMLAYFYAVRHFIYLSFMLGVSLCFARQYARSTLAAFSAALMVPIALILGSYPADGNCTGTLFAHLGHMLMEFHDWFHTVGAYLLVYSFVICQPLQRIAGMRLYRYLGHISFSLYLLHMPLIGAISCPLFLSIYTRVGYNTAAGIALAATTAVLLPASWLMTRYVDVPGIAFAKWAGRKLVRPAPDQRIAGSGNNCTI